MNDYLVIELANRRLHVFQNGTLHTSFPVAVGRHQSPTPSGGWKVINKKILPDAGVFGSRWIGLNNPGYGIHGTNDASSIGTAVSMGCVRMHNADVEQLFSMVFIGMPVLIVP